MYTMSSSLPSYVSSPFFFSCTFFSSSPPPAAIFLLSASVLFSSSPLETSFWDTPRLPKHALLSPEARFAAPTAGETLHLRNQLLNPTYPPLSTPLALLLPPLHFTAFVKPTTPLSFSLSR